MKTEEVLESIARERRRLLGAVGALGPRASTAWVTEEGGWTAKDVRAEFERVIDLLVDRVRLRSDEEMAEAATALVPWAGEGALWHFVGYDTFLHEWPAHARQIEEAVARSRPGDRWRGEGVEPCRRMR